MGGLKQYTFIQEPSLSLLLCKTIWKEDAQLRQLENTCKLLIVVNYLRADRCMIQQVALKDVKIKWHRCQEKYSLKSQAPVWVCAKG